MDGELHLRLLVEDAVAAGTVDFGAVARHLGRIAAHGRALRAAGAVSADVVAGIVAEAELALFLRGASWLESVQSDLPVPSVEDTAGTAPRLKAVASAGPAVAEVWDRELVVRAVGTAPLTIPGALPEGHDRLEVRTSAGLVAFDLAHAARAHEGIATVRPLGIRELAVVWAIASGAMPPRAPSTPASAAALYDVIAVTSGDVTVVAIERGEVLHARLGASPAAAWITSPEGVHVVEGGSIIDPPVPPPPAPLSLLLADDGWVREIVLRP